MELPLAYTSVTLEAKRMRSKGYNIRDLENQRGNQVNIKGGAAFNKSHALAKMRSAVGLIGANNAMWICFPFLPILLEAGPCMSWYVFI